MLDTAYWLHVSHFEHSANYSDCIPLVSGAETALSVLSAAFRLLSLNPQAAADPEEKCVLESGHARQCRAAVW